MENMSRAGNYFVFLGILEMEKYRIPYSILILCLYIIPTLFCCLMVYVMWVEESLHEPMYVLISNLLINGVFGNTAIYSHLIVGLLSGSPNISFYGCITQAFCMHSFSAGEMLTFTTMAYDRYLAVGNPLRYSSLMTTTKALKYIGIIWVFAFIYTLVTMIMAAKLTFCGVDINNVFCEHTSLLRLACGDTSVNNIFGFVQVLLVLISTLLIVIYCYIRTLVICLKTSGSTSLKAVHTLVSHMITFSIFMTTSLFIFLRYRLNGGNVSITAHVILCITGFLTSIIINPIVYGLRTETLKLKLIHNIQNTYIVKKFSKQQ